MIIGISDIPDIRNIYRDSKIALCHGVFNYLHAGHILHLEWAKGVSDILVVGVTGDRFVDSTRGSFLLSEKDRARLIDSLSFVDYVVISDHLTAKELLVSLAPDFYIKGSEYKNNMTEGLKSEMKFCKKILFSDTEKVASSTDSIKDITEAIDIYEDTERVDCILYSLARYKFLYRLLHDEETVFDVGCGFGYGTKLLSKACKSIVGYDINKLCIDRASQRFRDITFIHKDIMKAEVDPVDVVVCMEVIEHLEDPDSFLERVKSLARKYVVLSTPKELPFEERSKVRQMFHTREYTYDSLEKLLRKHFDSVLIFTQTDEIVSSGNPEVCWTYIAVCF